MKFRYVPGLRPTPMLMYYVQPEKNVYNEMIKDQSNIITIGQYSPNLNHIWNMNSYIIYDDETLKISSVVINSFSNFIYLLRNMNKPLTIEIDDNTYNILTSYVEDIFKDEFEKI